MCNMDKLIQDAGMLMQKEKQPLCTDLESFYSSLLLLLLLLAVFPHTFISIKLCTMKFLLINTTAQIHPVTL